MTDLTDFERDVVVGAHLAGASMAVAANILGRPRSTVLAVMK